MISGLTKHGGAFLLLQQLILAVPICLWQAQCIVVQTPDCITTTVVLYCCTAELVHRIKSHSPCCLREALLKDKRPV